MSSTTLPKSIPPQDIQRIVQVLAAQAEAHPVSPQAFCESLVRGANLPQAFELELVSAWSAPGRRRRSRRPQPGHLGHRQGRQPG